MLKNTELLRFIHRKILYLHYDTRYHDLDHLSLETRDCLSTKRLEQEINIVGLNK